MWDKIEERAEQVENEFSHLPQLCFGNCCWREGRRNLGLAEDMGEIGCCGFDQGEVARLLLSR